MELTVATMRTIAKEALIVGVSKLRKAELESAIFGKREGRMAFYKLRDDKFANDAIETVTSTGSFLLPRPVIKNRPANWKGDKLSPEEKENYSNKAEYVGKIRAIKSIIFENNMRHVRFHEDDAGFHMSVQRK